MGSKNTSSIERKLAKTEAEMLWQFTCAWWKETGVEQICLDWQNRFSLDASVFVWVAWLAEIRQFQLSTAELQRALNHIGEWRENVTIRVRNTRKTLRNANPSLSGDFANDSYTKLRSLELMSEQYEQIQLLNLKLNADANPEPARSGVYGNMSVYLELLSPSLSIADHQNLERVANKAENLLTKYH